MSGRPWYPHNPRDFLDGIVGMAPDTIGAYIVTIDLMYARGGSIPHDTRWLSGLMGCSTRMAAALVQRLIDAGKLSLSDGQLTNARVIIELENAAKFMRNAAESGAKGGRTAAENKARANENNDVGLGSLYQETLQDITEQDIAKTNPTDCQKAPAAKRGSRLPPDWKFPDDWIDWTVSNLGWQACDATSEAENFADYWHAKAGAGATKLDWFATWRGWCKRAKGYGNGQHGSMGRNDRPRGGVVFNAVRELYAEAVAAEEAEALTGIDGDNRGTGLALQSVARH